MPRESEPVSRVYQGIAEDIPDSHEHILLAEGQGKVEVRDVAENPNTQLFTINKEDHTLGNLISQRLLKHTFVEFSAYQVPHPHKYYFQMRVTTDGTMTPTEAVVKCCRDVVLDLDKLKSDFTTELTLEKAVDKTV
jgi:DNA-directed RNA polymerase II subunit RPB11